MAGHAERAHALLSASGSHRWLTCTPSAKLEADFPDTTSDAAREGTLAHELAEAKVRNYFYSVDFGKRKLTNAIKKMKENELWNDEMKGYTDEYLDYIKSEALKLSEIPYAAIEYRVNLGKYIPDGFGTADCILIQGELIHIIDFKYGKGVSVKAEDNPQMMLYALGAYEAFRLLYPIKRVKMSIVQPRLADGISSWEIPLGELLEFGEYVQERAELAMNGEGEFAPGANTCKFCRARNNCRARAEHNVKMAFPPLNLPPLITDEEVGDYLTKGEDLAAWLNDLKDYALGQCLAGKDIPGWKAVEGRGSRGWTDMDKAFEILEESGIDEAVLYERKPLTLAQVEKVVGKKDFTEKVGDLVVKNPGKPALVKESDRREPIKNTVSAAEAFKE